MFARSISIAALLGATILATPMTSALAYRLLKLAEARW
jgi:hypothetical protein